MSHLVILAHLRELQRTYAYVRDFLTNRQAVLHAGEVKSHPINLASRGTPQGAVHYAMLFIIALIELPQRLAALPNIKHGLYADDVTVWTGTGSWGDMEARLQEAADVVIEYAKYCGLSCAPQKSDLLVVQPGRPNRDSPPPVKIHLEGHTIRPTPQIKILGMVFQEDKRNSTLITRLKHTTDQVSHLLRRIITKSRGFVENAALRLVHAFIISRITDAVPYSLLNKHEEESVN